MKIIADQHLPKVETSAQTIKVKWQNFTKNKAEAIREKARRESVRIGLTLKPITGSVGISVIVWAMLLGLFFYGVGF